VVQILETRTIVCVTGSRIVDCKCGSDREIVEVGGDGLKSSIEAPGALVCMRNWDGGRL